MDNLIKIIALLAGTSYLAIYFADCDLGYIIGAWIWGIISIGVLALLICYVMDQLKSK
jgi:hypothetical protein